MKKTLYFSLAVLLTVLLLNTGHAAMWSDYFTGGAQQEWGVKDNGNNTTYGVVENRYHIYTESGEDETLGVYCYVNFSGTNAEIQSRVQRIDEGDDYLAGVALRGNATDQNGYFMFVNSRSPNAIMIYKMTNGQAEYLTHTDSGSFDQHNCIMKFKAEGDHLYGKVWTYGTPEPDNWQIETMDASHACGTAGILVITSAGGWTEARAAFDDVVFTTDSASPEVTEVTLSSNPSSNYLFLYDHSQTEPWCHIDGLWIEPGKLSSADSSPPPWVGDCGPVARTYNSTLTGSQKDSYGNLLLCIDGSSLEAFNNERNAFGDNMPINVNESVFGRWGGNEGPINKNNINLRGIPVGTEVTFTVKMNNEIPHALAVMGGSMPDVVYNPAGFDGAGELIITTTTNQPTSNEGWTPDDSVVGFLIFTKPEYGINHIGLIGQSNHWGGDMFVLLPGYDYHASIDAGDMGATNAKAGMTMVGQTGHTREVNVFFPNRAIGDMFGPGINEDQIMAFVNNNPNYDATITKNVTNFSLPGTLAEFDCTFASPVSVCFGVPQGEAMIEWTADGTVADGKFGWRVSSAGDVNGDGYDDVIISSPYMQTAYVYHGSATGLKSTPDWSYFLDNSAFGSSVASAGDVNGDGYDDIIVGAFYFSDLYPDLSQQHEGAAFVFYGSASGLSTTPDWMAQSNQAFAEFGVAVCSAGDVNGDGYSDVAVGARNYDGKGAVFVYYGSAAGLSPAPNWFQVGDQAGAEYGIAVNSAGDVNGDGFSDLVVGAWLYDGVFADQGRAYVYHGSSGGLSSTHDWTATVDQAGAKFGACNSSSAGDVNGDGYDDVLIGAGGWSNPESNEAGAFVFHGSASGLSASPNWSGESNQAYACTIDGGWSSGAGDVNGDGYDDIILGLDQYDHEVADEGVAIVILGSASGLADTFSYIYSAGQAGAEFGYIVAPAGDVNGDGLGDVIIGAPSFDSNGLSNNGRVFVYYGQCTNSITTPPNLINWNDGFTDNLVADFGDRGLWYHNGSSWNWMTNRGHVGQMAVWDGKLVVDFGAGYGMHYYDGAGWTWMSNKGDVNLMTTWNQGTSEKLVVDFGNGRRIYTYDGSWQWFNNKDDVAGMTVWNNNLVVDFGNGRGMYYNGGAGWTWMSNKDDVAMMLNWNDGFGEKLVVDFGAGRRVYTYNNAWQWLSNKDDVNAMAVASNINILVVDFGNGRGMYYNDGTGWTWMTNKDDVAKMVTWDDGSGDKLAVDFGGGRGMHYYDGVWHWMRNADDVPEMIAWGNRLAVDFGSGVGIYNYDGSWNWMRNWSTRD